MSLTTSFKESEVPAWIKERLRTWHTQLFTDLDYVDFTVPHADKTFSSGSIVLSRHLLPIVFVVIGSYRH